MDQYISAVIIAAMTGIFSIITIVIQKRQDKIINKIDEQTMFIEKEKGLKQRLIQREKERESIIQEIMILILDTNLHILKNTQIAGATVVDDTVFERSENLKHRFSEVSTSIKEITKEYEMVLDMTNMFNKELEKVQSQK
jgi:lipopolysaccharide export LptBFGC system permease protein LptF